ncbi:MAG: PQQ-like beta-propeller repeat protein, partial [Prevotellaceae bacterium]|nr:PQQ-like beta-propeller repeat protein [Prevotellaceae bacterium]
ASAQENWAQFRGPNGQGISTAKDLPVSWDSVTNIAWKTNIEGEAWSSPIVWGSHIFLTATTEEGKNCHVMAVDTKTGKMLWNKIVFTQTPNQHMHNMNSHATPTPVTDGKTVYAVFSGGGFAALDFSGNVQWTNTEMNFYSQHGMGTSPILYKDLLILAVNSSSREEKNLGFQKLWDKSYLLALDKNTGKERWRGSRGMSRIAHSTPVVMQVEGKDQIISMAGDVVQGFDPANGKQLWTVTSVGEPCVPTPAISDSFVYIAHTSKAPIRAVRPNGSGDCTATHIAWETSGTTPMMSSLLYVKPYLYVCPDSRLCCLDAATGELLWQIRLKGGQLNPSPLYADGKIYTLSEQGVTTVLKPSNDPKTPAEIVSINALGGQARASIAVAGKQLIIRTANQLWCIGK